MFPVIWGTGKSDLYNTNSVLSELSVCSDVHIS